MSSFISTFWQSIINIVIASAFLFGCGSCEPECYDITKATVEGAPCMGMAGVGGCSNGSADPLRVKPDGVQHCRKQFRFFPCCHLKDGSIKDVKKTSCDKTYQNIPREGTFLCDDLLKFDPEALFFFIKESSSLEYNCISVCYNGIELSIISSNLILALCIFWVYSVFG
eukprot:TRINITY_DN9814_c0_g1_i1.p1 TRINITY_DN9814_c0_g1~~TRINITY_DN9814_c0_g1_i1.p1  ORF type:complete len:169 (-),score=32.63 TRINITY_DN9814_c0_g1_i1:71-577(-)